MSYANLPGGQSLEYAASQIFKFDTYEDFPVKTVVPYLDDEFEYCYAVHLPKCKSQDMNKYFRWCFQTYGASGFEFDGGGRRFFFREEKNRTMFLLKWGHR
jgi:hypothetical protein